MIKEKQKSEEVDCWRNWVQGGRLNICYGITKAIIASPNPDR